MGDTRFLGGLSAVSRFSVIKSHHISHWLHSINAHEELT